MELKFIISRFAVLAVLLAFQGCLEAMEQVDARYGAFAVLGNHEHYSGKLPDILAAFRGSRIVLLRNAHRVLYTPCGRFAVAGIDDLRSGQPDFAAALQGLDRGIPVMLLSHQPEVFPEAAGHDVPLTLFRLT